MESEKPKRDYVLPASIIIAALLISGALVYNVGRKSGSVGENVAGGEQGPVSVDNIRPVSAADHIYGKPDAPVKVVEFSDLECPFCKSFHLTMKRVVDFYDGQVAWVYRHFPLDQLHPKARKEAEAAECAAELGGNEKFWDYVDRIFEITPSNNGLNLSLLPQAAADIGLDKKSFQSCLDSGKYAQKVADDLQDAINSGGRGTPYSVVIANNGRKLIIPGALPFSDVRQIIEEALK